MPIAVIVDWYGPYQKYESFTEAASDWGPDSKVLYMGVKRKAPGGNLRSVDYIGLSTNPSIRFQNHHKLKEAKLDEYYAGEISSAGIPGRRSKKTAPDLDFAEGALISMLQPSLNDRRKIAPKNCIVVYSRFFDPDGEYEPQITPVWFPSVIAYHSWSGEWSR
jgi:hypothetical protein